MAEPVDATWIAQNLSDRSSNGIDLGMRALIRSGLIPIGTRLPPIRDIASAMGVSPATVAAAWARLQKQRILTGQGRNGTWVSGARSLSVPKRFASSGNFGASVLDLSFAVPDPALLPRLHQALAHGAEADQLNSYARVAILPELEEAVRPDWPYAPEAFLAINGGYSAVHTLFHALSLRGARVAVEYPAALRHLDILEDLGATILPVACDTEGPLPDRLAEVLAQRPEIFLLQPRLHSVTGQTLSPSRLAALAQVLAHGDTVVIEDDGLADLALVPAQSLGRWLPERVVHVKSFSKTHGPDLRLAVLSGPSGLVAQVRGYRAFSSGWTSRILQGATAWLLRDPATQDLLARARIVYRDRRAALVDALRAEGVMAEPGTGLCAWVPVASEQYAMVSLAAHGIAVAPGSRFGLAPLNHLRVATSRLDPGRIADVVHALVLGAADPQKLQ
ncbi:GntR family transcriptional regulator [Sinirhodobacter populi]|nr:GntR family transcriptional regulator [Sinirhodobacter populi]